MDRGFTTAKPPLLMVSHCVPDALGGEDRTRAWQLLRLAGQTHRVFLACVLDGPVNLAQWRTVNDQTQLIAIESKPTGGAMIRRLLSFFNSTAIDPAVASTALVDPIKQWSNTLRFDAMICTHASLWPDASTVESRVRICDLRTRARRRRRRSDAEQKWRLPQPLRRLTNERSISPESNLVIVDDECRHLCDGKPYDLIELKNTIDPDYFAQNCASPLLKRYTPNELRVVVHCDWSYRLSSQSASWFERRVWPSIKQAVPEAKLQNTRPGSADPSTTLSNASIIVVPVASSTRASLPVLQAIAMRRPVIGTYTGPTPEAGLPRNGEELVLCRNERDWAARCIVLLRSASERLRLTHNASDFIDNYSRLEQSGQPLIQALLDPALTRQPVRRAA